MGRGSGTGKPVGRIAAIAMLGASIEWYDFFIYGTAAALIFPGLFFPPELSPIVAQLAAFGTFAVGFIARPVGAVLFGHFGDLIGRKRALVFALVLMGATTTLIGLVPTYATAGAWGPLLLVILRFAQGVSIGGQWGGAALLVIENAPAHRRGYFGSFAQAGVPAGVVLANAVFLGFVAQLDMEAFRSWGWRVPFLLSLILIGLGLYVQLRLEDSEEFETLAAAQTRAQSRSPILHVLHAHWRRVALAGGAFMAVNGCFYVLITYSVAYGVTSLGIHRDVMLTAVIIGNIVMGPALVLAGALSDRWGRVRLYLAGAVLMGLWSFAVFPLIETGIPVLITLSVSVGMVVLAVMYGPQAALFAELFTVDMRYSGASLGYQFGAILGGGFAPIIATALYGRFETSLAVAIYMAASCAVSFICALALARHHGDARPPREAA